MNLNRRSFLGLLGITPVVPTIFGNVYESPFLWKTTAYKLVNTNYLSPFSAVTLKYSLGEIIEPKAGKIFVFNNMKDAIYNLEKYCKKILEVKVKNLNKVETIPWGGSACSTKIVEEAWKSWEFHSKYNKLFGQRPMDGTCICDAVKVIKEIKI